jgi:hypothetical protein
MPAARTATCTSAPHLHAAKCVLACAGGLRHVREHVCQRVRRVRRASGLLSGRSPCADGPRQQRTQLTCAGVCRGNAMPVTDAHQRVSPAMSFDDSRIDHAQIAYVTGIDQRNKRLVVHHYASRSGEDYETKLQRGAGDHKRDAHFRGLGFFNALNACAPLALLRRDGADTLLRIARLLAAPQPTRCSRHAAAN